MRLLLAAIGFAQIVAMAPAASLEYGLLFWTNRFKGAGDYSDSASAFAIDYRGNIVVTGSSWTGHSYDYLTIAFSSDGAPLWTNRYSGSQSYNSKGVATDRSGAVFVTGFAQDGNYRYTITTVAISQAGVPLWTNMFGDAQMYAAGDNCIAVNDKGTVFITGSSYTVTNNGYRLYDLVLIAYSRNGVPLWTNLYSAPGNSYDDHSSAVAVDTVGNVFICGGADNGTFAPDCVTLGYNENGTPLWTNSYSGVTVADFPNDYVMMLMAAGSNAVYVTGGTWSGDFLTLAYSKTGIPLWTNFYNDVRNRNDRATAIAVDSSDNVYVTGRSVTDFGRNDVDYATVAYSASGIPLWTNTYNGRANGEDYAIGVAVDARANVFVTGWSRGTGSNFDFVTIVYSNSGVPLYTNGYDTGGDDRPFIRSPIRTTEDGFVIVSEVSGIVKYLTYGPVLGVSRSAAEVSLSWPSVWGNFVLQESFDRGISRWSNVPQSPAGDGVRRRVSVPVEPGRRLFRLSQ